MRQIFIFIFLFPFSCLAQPNKIKLIDNYLRGEYEQGFNGNVLIAKDKKILYQHTFGYRNYPLKQTLKNSSSFELASISKQFTAVAVLLLKEQGKLRLSDSLRMYFPKLQYSGITIYQLLTHTSGLPDYQNEMDMQWDHRQIAFNKDIINFFVVNRPSLYFKPGTQYKYSNTGYVFLASIIEKITGNSFGSYLQKKIFKPLGMNNSRVYNSRRSKNDTIKDYAYGYVYDKATNKYTLPDSVKQDDIVYWLDGVTGDGCVNSTTSDLLEWENALLNHKLLTKEDQTDMFFPHVLADTSINLYYGFGVELGKDETGNFITHNGVWPGYLNVITHYQHGDYTIIVLSNDQFNANGVSKGLIFLLNGKAVVMPYSHKQIFLNENALQRFVGEYAFPAQIEIIQKDGRLYRHLPGRSAASDVELKPESKEKLFYSDKIDIQLEFSFDDNNRIRDVFVVNCGIKTQGVPVR